MNVTETLEWLKTIRPQERQEASDTWAKAHDAFDPSPMERSEMDSRHQEEMESRH